MKDEFRPDLHTWLVEVSRERRSRIIWNNRTSTVGASVGQDVLNMDLKRLTKESAIFFGFVLVINCKLNVNVIFPFKICFGW